MPVFKKLSSPLNALIFDCDGTLSQIEGIDEIAKNHQAYSIVHRLTQDAMSKTGMTPEIYAERLRLTQPQYQEIISLGHLYYQHRIPKIENLIAIFKKLKKEIYIVSAGFLPAVLIFAEKLKIPAQNVYAVALSFDEKGHYRDFDKNSPLIKPNGKREIVKHLLKKYPEIGFTGDGLSDYEVYDLVTRFIGYGGVYYRENIAKSCHFYINTLSLNALLPLLLTENEYHTLSSEDIQFYQQGMDAIQNSDVLIK